MADRDKVSDVAAIMMNAAAAAGEFETFCAAIDMLHGIAHSAKNDPRALADVLEVIIKGIRSCAHGASSAGTWRV